MINANAFLFPFQDSPKALVLKGSLVLCELGNARAVRLRLALGFRETSKWCRLQASAWPVLDPAFRVFAGFCRKTPSLLASRQVLQFLGREG